MSLKRTGSGWLHFMSSSGSDFSCNLYSSVIQKQDNLLGFVSKTAMWVELLCQWSACPPPVVLMLSELLSNSQKGSETACTGRQVCLVGVNSEILHKMDFTCACKTGRTDWCMFGFNKNLANKIKFHLHLPSFMHAFYCSLLGWSDGRNISLWCTKKNYINKLGICFSQNLNSDSVFRYKDDFFFFFKQMD